MVGIKTGDDAAVYRLTDDLCIIQTVDFFPPIVDDPYDFGAIAVANAVSDVYAMGGVPLLGLNLACFPEDLPKEILYRILQGGADKAREAGLLVAGGHTIKDREPKYGMAVTGLIAPGDILTNSGAKPGDRLVLTKPLGTGIITTAGKAQQVERAVLEGAVNSMATLNHTASHAAQEVGVNACTDVTGFGLIGHLHTMMTASGTSAQLQLSAIPLLPGVRELVERGIVPGGTRTNFDTVGQQTHWHPEVSDEEKLLLCDAQTSGGLLLSVPEERVEQLVRELESRDIFAAVIGTVAEQGRAPIEVTP